MTTPAINSAYAIISDAYEDAGLTQATQDLNGAQLAKGMKRLRDIINICQPKGLKMFSWLDQSVTLVAGQAAYTFFPGGSADMTKPLRVLQAFYLYTATNVRRPITVMSANDYYLLGMAGTLTSNQGPVSQYYVQKLYDKLTVTFWLCPDTTEAANGTAHLFLQKQITNPLELDETVEFPPEWRIYLRWALAADLATGQPQAVIDRCEGKAALYGDLLDGWDVEDAPTSIQPDARTGVPGNFR